LLSGKKKKKKKKQTEKKEGKKMSRKIKGIFHNISIHMFNHCGELVCIFSRQTQHAEKTDLKQNS
jgi:hypothetical protein